MLNRYIQTYTYFTQGKISRKQGLVKISTKQWKPRDTMPDTNLNSLYQALHCLLASSKQGGWVKDKVTTFQYFGLQLCHNADVYLNMCLPPFPHLKELVLAVVLLKITWDHAFFQCKIQQTKWVFLKAKYEPFF